MVGRVSCEEEELGSCPEVPLWKKAAASRMLSTPSSWQRQDFMVKATRKAMLKEFMLVSLKEGNMECSKIGSYLGFAMTWKKLLHAGSDEKHSKKAKVLESLIEMIEKFPHEDPVYERLQDDLEKIRGRFKQACSLLHIPTDARLGSGGSALTF
nr:PREDICTED: oral cancer-overexpressed protein 1 isoform X1 [Anolis carolinensis]|eukprot:XP_008104221.1 PREDICTED: oral cancer-overexpressed protein 1 isoform X1 [Anolis carolinensis]